MKLLSKKNKYLLASFLIILSFSYESQGALGKNVTPSFMDDDLTSENVVKSMHSYNFPMHGTQFNAEWHFNDKINDKILESRILSPVEQVFITLSDTLDYAGGEVKTLPTGGRIATASVSHIYKMNLFDNHELQGDPLATLYLGGPSVPSTELKSIASVGFKTAAEGLKIGIQATAAHLAQKGAEALTAVRDAVAPETKASSQ